MEISKMREQFESAWRARYPAHGDVALKRSGLDPEDYCNTRVKDAWWAWQASRYAVAIVIDMRDGEISVVDIETSAEEQGVRVETLL